MRWPTCTRRRQRDRVALRAGGGGWRSSTDTVTPSDFPPVLSTLLDAAEKAGSTFASLTHVSGLDTPPTIRRLHEKTAPVLDRLRQSETSGFVRSSAWPTGRAPPTAGAQRRVRLVDDYDREVPEGTPGEIVVAARCLPGLFGQPDVTATPSAAAGIIPGRGALRRRGLPPLRQAQAGKELIKPGGENVYPGRSRR